MVAESPSPIIKTTVRLFWPLFVLPYLVAKYLYRGVFGWWLDAWLTSRDRRRLLRDIVDYMPFLASNGKVVTLNRSAQPFDYASIYLEIDRVLVCITRGQGEVSVTLAPLAYLRDWYEFGMVVEALDDTQGTTESISAGLKEADRALELHWESIRREFSEARYSQFKLTLSEIKRNRQKATRELEWQLNKHMSRL